MDMLGIITVFAAFFLLALLLKVVKVPRNILLMAETEDEDIKIAGGSFGNTTDELEEVADEAAQEFLRQKQVGNIDKAGKLGDSYATTLWEIAKVLLMDEDSSCNQDVHHTLALYSYIINKVVVDHSPTPLLAQTALSVFSNRVREISTVLEAHISDTGAITLYMLNDRNENKKEIGKIYAGLCGDKSNQEKIDEGNRLYDEFYEVSSHLYNTHTGYIV